MHLIKRYSNRKLYDTLTKSYITLENIAQLVRAGDGVQVLENDTGEDITAVVLAQIITEETRKNKAYAPSVFVNMIQKSGGFMWDRVRKIAQTVGETAYSLEEEIEQKIRRLVSSGKISSEEGQALQHELQHEVQKYRNKYLQKWETYLEASLQSMLQKLSIPTKSDVAKLTQIISTLEQRIAELSQGNPPQPSGNTPQLPEHPEIQQASAAPQVPSTPEVSQATPTSKTEATHTAEVPQVLHAEQHSPEESKKPDDPTKPADTQS